MSSITKTATKSFLISILVKTLSRRYNRKLMILMLYKTFKKRKYSLEAGVEPHYVLFEVPKLLRVCFPRW